MRHIGQVFPFVLAGTLLTIGMLIFAIVTFRYAPKDDLLPPYYDSPEEARPLPMTLDPNTFRDRRVQEAYTIARALPEVLAQLPCLCGCHLISEDHRSLLDCFVDRHAET